MSVDLAGPHARQSRVANVDVGSERAEMLDGGRVLVLLDDDHPLLLSQEPLSDEIAQATEPAENHVSGQLVLPPPQ